MAVSAGVFWFESRLWQGGAVDRLIQGGWEVLWSCVFFFFQAEDGIRDVAVTGVQTCALPISLKYEPISARPDAIAYRAGKFIRRHQSPVVAALVVTLALIGTTIFTWFFPGRSELLRQFNQRKLTAIGQDSPGLNAAICPDGKYLGYADQQGIHLQLVATSVVQSLRLPAGIQPGKASWAFGSWFPDSTRFLASASVPGKPSTVWSIPILGGEAQKLAEVEDMFGGGSVSPDGSHIRSEEHTSELQSRLHLVCRLLLEKKKKSIKSSDS